MPLDIDSIIALSTPPGRAGIGVIRISGPNSLSILRALVNDPTYDPAPNRLSLRALVDPFTGEILDQALVCFFRNPHSFTGEDLVELHCHGSPVLLQALIELLLKLDAHEIDDFLRRVDDPHRVGQLHRVALEEPLVDRVEEVLLVRPVGDRPPGVVTRVRRG